MTKEAFFEIVPARPIKPAPADGAVARGDDWRVLHDADGFWLHYMSGRQGGGEHAILIDQATVDALAAGERTADEVLIARGAS